MAQCGFKAMHGLRVPLHQFPHLLAKGKCDTLLTKSSSFIKPVAGLGLPHNNFNISGKYLSKNVIDFFFKFGIWFA